MISIAYVNNEIGTIYSSDPLLKFQQEINSIAESAIHAYDEYQSHLTKFITESEISGIEDLSELEILESEGNNIFAKIGNAILGIIKKFREALTKLLDKMKNVSFQNKSEMDKIDALIKKHPTLKEKIIAHASDFDFKDIDSIARMESQFKEILSASEPTKSQEILKKMQSVTDVTAKTAATITGGITLIAGFRKLKSDHVSVSKRINGSLESARSAEVKIATELGKLENSSKQLTPEQMEAARVLRDQLAAARLYTDKCYGAYRKYEQQSTKIFGRIKNALGIVGSTNEAQPRT